MSHPDNWSWVEWNNAPGASNNHGAAHAAQTTAPQNVAAPAPAVSRTISVDSNVSHMQRVAALRGDTASATTTKMDAPSQQSVPQARKPRAGAAGNTVRAMQAIDEETDVVVDAGSNTLLYVLVGLLVVLLIVYFYLMWRTHKRNADNEEAVKAAQSAADSRAAQPPPVKADPRAAPAQPQLGEQQQQQPLDALRGAAQSHAGGRVMMHTPNAAPAPRPAAPSQSAAPSDADKRAQLVEYANRVADAVQKLSAGDANGDVHDSVAAARAHFDGMDVSGLVLWIQKHEEVLQGIVQRETQAQAAQQQETSPTNSGAAQTAQELHSDSHARVTALEEVPDDASDSDADTGKDADEQTTTPIEEIE